MSHRFTALVLALIIASPMCWCGWTHASQVVHARSCCESSSKTEAPAKQKNCPCLQTLKARDMAQAKLKVPDPALVDLCLPDAEPILLDTPRVITLSAALALPHDGPPREARPLYHLGCALLI